MKRKIPGTIIICINSYRNCTYGGSMFGKCNYCTVVRVTVSYYFIIVEYSSRIMGRSIAYFRAQIPAGPPMSLNPEP